MGLPMPAAEVPTTTIAPPKSFGNSTAETEFDFCDQSIQILLYGSVAIFPNLGILTASTPSSEILTWKLGSPLATRKVSSPSDGYNFPLDDTTIGILRTTPSSSGKVLTIPAPTVTSLICLVFACMFS